MERFEKYTVNQIQGVLLDDSFNAGTFLELSKRYTFDSTNPIESLQYNERVNLSIKLYYVR